MRAACACAALALCTLAGVASPAAAPPAAFAQSPGAALPLDAAFVDSTGRALRLGDEFRAARPVILVLGYARCPQLCGLVIQGLLEAAHASGLPADAYRIVFASVDPRETPADAAARRGVELGYARVLAGAGEAPALDVLVGPPASIAALARATGFRYAATPEAGASRFAHPAGAIVATPGGRVSRYLPGVRWSAGELRDALAAASRGEAGPVDDRLALLCAHLDARLGRWSAPVLLALRLAGLATLAGLGLLALRPRPRAGRGGR